MKNVAHIALNFTQKHSHGYMQSHEHTIIVTCSNVNQPYTAKQAWGELHCKVMLSITIILLI